MKINLTTRGKHTLIMVLTLAGCVIGGIAAVLISGVCNAQESGSYLVAGGNESTAVRDSDGNQTEKDFKKKYNEQCSEGVSPQWLFYQSRGGEECDEETKGYLDTLVNRWTKGKLTDNELTDLMTEYLIKQNYSITTSGIQSKVLCLFLSAEELPDYTKMLAMGECIYDFIGVYTQGDHDEDGRLICYYWEAGVR